MCVRNDMHMVSVKEKRFNLMRKMFIAAVCGFALIAACVVSTQNDAQPKMAGSGILIHVTV